MSTPVVMPQMGESIAEGTIVRWIKKVGDTVDRDEPLFEISTDKVDAEIPSPAAGVLLGDRRARRRDGPRQQRRRDDRRCRTRPLHAGARRSSAQAPAPRCQRRTARLAVPAAAPPSPRCRRGNGAGQRARRRHRHAPRTTCGVQRSSPLVRRIAKEHGVDITGVPGSGIGGRVTKQDILGFIEQARASAPSPRRRPASAAGAASRVSRLASASKSCRCR